MKPSSEKRLQQLHPALTAALRKVVADLAAQGITIEVVQGLRTFAEQDALYAQGRTKPGPIVTQAKGGESNHNYGLAADLCPFVNDKPDWNAPLQVWGAIGAAAQAHGLDWGGAWKKFLDKPHVELPKMTVKECLGCFKTGGIQEVWTTASKRIGWVDVDAVPAGARGIAARSLTTLATGVTAARGLQTAAKKTAKRAKRARVRATSRTA